jgi:hypothetical protein
VVEIGNGEPVDITTATAADAARLIRKIKYLLRGYIPFGMITGIVAEPGKDKSAFALWLARTIMTGRPWFNGMPGPRTSRPVLWCDTENSMAITLQRMEDWKIPQARLILPFDDALETINLTNGEHLTRIEDLINKHHLPAVFIDSLRGGHDGNENDSQVGAILQSLAAIAQRTNAAFIVVHHTRKLMVGEEITANSSRGSNAILALMRSQIGIDQPDPKSRTVRFRMLKENLGLAPIPLGFTVTAKGLIFGPAPQKPRKNTKKESAKDWLCQWMEPGRSYLSNEILEDAKRFGFSSAAIQRAREDLGMTQDRGFVRRGPGDRYEWCLPPDVAPERGRETDDGDD